jgi:hypothetical protein
VESTYAAKMPDWQFRSSGANVGFSLKQARHDVLHQLLGSGARIGRDPRKLRFLLGSEVYFHTIQDKGKPALEQSQKPGRKPAFFSFRDAVALRRRVTEGKGLFPGRFQFFTSGMSSPRSAMYWW